MTKNCFIKLWQAMAQMHVNIAPDQFYGYCNMVCKKETFMYFFEIHSCLPFEVSQKSLSVYPLAEGEHRASAASSPAAWTSTWKISLLATLGTIIKHFLGMSEKKKNQNNWLGSSDLLTPLISITRQIVLQSFVLRV